MLEPSELESQILSNLESYSSRSSFECFALLLGKAQILEFGLKNLRERNCGYMREEMEKWTLGRVASEMAAHAFRADYIGLLKDFVRQRNYIAHEMLASNAILRSMAPGLSPRFEFRQLQQPAYDLERLLILHDWCEEHHAWGLSIDA